MDLVSVALEVPQDRRSENRGDDDHAEKAGVEVLERVGVGAIQQDLAIGAANGTETLGGNAEERKSQPRHKVNVGGDALNPEAQLEGEEFPKHGDSLVLRVAGEIQEIDVLQHGRDGMEPGAGRGRREDADFVLSAGKVRADHMEVGFQGAKFVVGGHDPRPDLPFDRGQCFRRHALQQNLAIGDDRHARAKLVDIVHDMGGKNDRHFAPDGGEKIEEAVALGGVETGGRLVHDDEARIGEQRLGDAEALFMPPE